MRLAAPLERLAEEFARLPGIGPKSAQRLALHIMRISEEEVLGLSDALVDVRNKVAPCQVCGYYTESNPCQICSDEIRDNSVLCLVEEAKDVIAMERTGYRGKYFVLGNSFHSSGLPDLRAIDFEKLFQLSRQRGVQEIIVATNPTIDGEVIARYVAERVRDQNISVTKLALGLPVGGDIEYIDEITLKRALDGRSPIK